MTASPHDCSITGGGVTRGDLHGSLPVTFWSQRSTALEPGLLDVTTRGPPRGHQCKHITLPGQAEAPEGQPCLGLCSDQCRTQTQAPLGLTAAHFITVCHSPDYWKSRWMCRSCHETTLSLWGTQDALRLGPAPPSWVGVASLCERGVDFAGPEQRRCPLSPRSFPEYKTQKVSAHSREESHLLLQGFLTLGAEGTTSIAQEAVAWEAL